MNAEEIFELVLDVDTGITHPGQVAEVEFSSLIISCSSFKDSLRVTGHIIVMPESPWDFSTSHSSDASEW